MSPGRSARAAGSLFGLAGCANSDSTDVGATNAPEGRAG